jgi:CRISPR-associated endonuclease/helicase Cas3
MSEDSTNSSTFYARWTDDRTKPQPLCLHLENVSRRANVLAELVRGSDVAFVVAAKLTGLLHDLGKYRLAFQKYLNVGNRGRRSAETDHAIYGAAAGGVAWNALAVAFAIGGHHAGLHDLGLLMKQIDGSRYHAIDRFPELLDTADECDQLAGALAILKPNQDDLSDSLARLDFDEDDESDKRRFDVFVRMLFAILVDADRLDSEKFEQEHRRQRAWERPTRMLDPTALLDRLDAARRAKGAEKKESRPELNQLRDSVFEACRERGRNSSSGFFSLTVPTGGGKTISSMAFALDHARTHNLRRVIVVVPYLSIIEQNARDYRMIFGADQVLEHHSAVEVLPPKKPSDADAEEPPQALDIERAMENWDVPIVVTTAVQFIETLFAASPAKARKLHNVAQSVVIFDEVQTLPTHLLEPTLDVLRTLQQHFGVSVLFCSATQPAFLKSGNLRHGFQKGEVREIAPSPAELFQKLRRVQYRIEPAESCWNWDRLADEMLSLKRQQALAVVNLRQHAFDAYLALKARLSSRSRSRETSDLNSHEFSYDDAVFHLSSAMCAAHRLDLLGLSQTPPKNNIKQRLINKLPCWVISTQLIEAGVDIDFPTVFRAMGPLDSIVQAAGRCNREGQLRDESGQLIPGDVIVFHPEVTSARSGLPPGNYSKATGIAPSYLKDTERLATDPDVFAKYFNELFQITATDRVIRGEDTIQQSRAKLNFRTVAERAKVISEDTIGVIVPYGRAKKLIAVIRRTKRLDHGVLRRLQRFMVNLRRGPKSLYEQLNDEGRLQSLLPDIADIPVLDAECYDPQRGVIFKERSPEDFVQ